MSESLSDYSPPTSAEMLERQNEKKALKLLIAQRRLYSRAKRWLSLRWIGIIILGIAAPFVTVFWPNLAIYVTAISGVWVALAGSVLPFLQKNLTLKAAAVQERFDFHVYGMPESTQRSALPSWEDIPVITGSDDSLMDVAKDQKLLDWYPIDKKDKPVLSIALSQRANASYSDRLIRSTAIVWGVGVTIWIILLVTVSAILNISLPLFITGIALPVLPAIIEAIKYITGVWRSSISRRDLANTIEAQVKDTENTIDTQSLFVWQEGLYQLRTTAPDVPDFVYNLRRKVNEIAMHSAARQLSEDRDGNNNSKSL